MSKRAHEAEPDSPSKKLKSDASASAPRPPRGPIGFTPADLIAQKKAEIAAKLAALKQGSSTAPAAPAAVPPVASASSVVSRDVLSKPGAVADLAKRVAEAKQRVAAASSRTSDNPYLAAAQAKKPTTADTNGPQGAGLNMSAHPLLLEPTTVAAPTSKKDRYKPLQPKFASIKANARSVPATPPPLSSSPAPKAALSANPYLNAVAPRADRSEGIVFEGAPRERMGRSLKFNQKGKYVALASQQRQEQQLEALKARIAEGAKKAGLDAEFETLEKTIRREPPPDVEWWDQPFLKSYVLLNAFPITALPIRSDESPITIYIQHPIPLLPADASTTDGVALKPAKMTKKEMKKMRKQRRQADLQEKRDRIKMGLMPPDPPKVKLTNMMTVLANDAVADPTKVEVRVRREVAQRAHQHDKANAERKLTDEQRRAKVEQQKTEQERKGLVACAFRVRTLGDPSHRFKVRKNAEQMNLSGVCIYNPAFALIYVEGAHKFMRAYKKLMLNRVQWTEHARPRARDEGEDGGEPAEQPEQPDEEEERPNLEDNRCDLVWEGDIRERAFTSFRPKKCPSDSMAKETLGQKLEGVWDQAKAFVPPDTEL
ncbi:PRP3-domain-containing protein [Auriculariales sp. MPI-PUGE-AT-0066]|nr:PRP3-domain-containing protein [Auriculariales sp. MPI-PUGE-AT-0066]